MQKVAPVSHNTDATGATGTRLSCEMEQETVYSAPHLMINKWEGKIPMFLHPTDPSGPDIYPVGREFTNGFVII